MWEMKPYAEMAVQFGYYLEIVEPATSWRFEPRVLARKNVHRVPIETIEGMTARYQHSDVVTVETLYRMIDVKPKPWPPLVAAAPTNAVVELAAPERTAAAAGAASTSGVSQPWPLAILPMDTAATLRAPSTPALSAEPTALSSLQCAGDANWATNLLLDSNMVPVPAPEPQPQPQPQPPAEDSDSGADVIVESDASGSDPLSLTLPAEFAFQLQKLFGPTIFGPRTVSQLAELPDAERTIPLPLDLARRLHGAWLAGAGRAFDADQRSFEHLRCQVAEMARCEERRARREEEERQAMLRRDEEMARQLQLEEDGRHAGRAPPAPLASPTPQLREIMDMEEAFQRSEQTSGASRSSQAERLTRQRLRDEFPGVDPRYLDDVLEMHDGNYRQVLQVLEVTVPCVSRRAEPDRPPLRAAQAALAAGAEPGWEARDAGGGFLAPEGGLPTFQDLQAEAEVFRRQMRHAEQMAERAVRRGMAGVSQYYVEERDRVAGLLEECRVRAALTSVDLRHGDNPDQLDLHELVVDQALTVLASFIADRQRHFGLKGYRRGTVCVITGKGKHSRNGKAKIKPAVINWLTNKGVRFEVAPNNEGMLLVTVESEHLYQPRGV
ncbi:NEDD4-binding protein 2-like [Pollicipes pollicipes]|uniref:NEDD4-binding protein 2-like n=1 Tax=Pollicipes pollicipes TaxID=41117 RepID=UPI001885124F|nr:NEDD4-binding protein 2-like [Pollicipes pollicipes]